MIVVAAIGLGVNLAVGLVLLRGASSDLNTRAALVHVAGDALGAIVDWVEKGTAPDSIIATGQAFPGRSRPLCAYPKHAQYSGNGDTQNAHNFQCQDSAHP